MSAPGVLLPPGVLACHIISVRNLAVHEVVSEKPQCLSGAGSAHCFLCVTSWQAIFIPCLAQLAVRQSDRDPDLQIEPFATRCPHSPCPLAAGAGITLTRGRCSAGACARRRRKGRTGAEGTRAQQVTMQLSGPPAFHSSVTAVDVHHFSHIKHYFDAAQT